MPGEQERIASEIRLNASLEREYLQHLEKKYQAQNDRS